MSQNQYERLPMIEKIAEYAHSEGITAEAIVADYKTPKGQRVRYTSTKSLLMNGKRCRVSTPKLIRRVRQQRRRYTSLKKPTPEVLRTHEFFVVLVDIKAENLNYRQIFCIPTEHLKRLPKTKGRNLWLPLEEKEEDHRGGFPPNLDWNRYAGKKGFDFIRGTARDYIYLTGRR